MYTLSVPFVLSQLNTYSEDRFIEQLKNVGADTVFLALGSYELNEEKRRAVFSALEKYVPIFRAAGFRVGVWVWTFMVCEKSPFVHITSPNGKVASEEMCPSDASFRAFSYEYLKGIARSHPDIILFDDDFRYGFLDCGLGCACQNHRDYMSELLGEPVPMEGLGQRVFGGSRNKYRSAFLKANGHFFRLFAEGVREAVDSVDPSIRVGLCACMTTWDFDGISAAELSRILAGENTKPFLRLIGAPYWAQNRNWGNRLADVIELERMESSWCGEGIEILAEGDAFPRPRFTCSANMLEGFDMALRASGATKGIHKYVLDYVSPPTYETGYVKKHLKNQKIYQAIHSFFDAKTPVGIRVYEGMTKFEDMDVPACYSGSDNVQDTFFSIASRMLVAHSLPTTFEGLGTGAIAFGENAKMLDENARSRGVILDVCAAEILTRCGIDVGLLSVGGSYRASAERFAKKGYDTNMFSCPAREIEISPRATVESTFLSGERTHIGSYTYENEKGERFLVFAFEGYTANEHALRQYARGEQIAEAIAWMGHSLPAKMLGNPDCYLLCRESDEGLAVFVGNFFTDECFHLNLTLSRAYESIEFFGTTGTLSGDTVTFDEIPPYACVGFLVR